MPEQSEGIPFFFLALDMGVARFQFSPHFLPLKLTDLDETGHDRRYCQYGGNDVGLFLITPSIGVVYLATPLLRMK